MFAADESNYTATSEEHVSDAMQAYSLQTGHHGASGGAKGFRRLPQVKWVRGRGTSTSST